MPTSALMRTGRLRVLCAAIAAGALLSISHPVAGQDAAAIIIGRIVTDAGAPAPGVSLRIAGTSHIVVTNDAGVFRFSDVPAGEVELVIEQIGWEPVRHVVPTTPGTTARVDIRLEPRALLLDQVVVTTSREAQRRAETPATVHSVSGAAIERLRPSHPSEVMNRIPGVWVNVTGGEGHMAAIRHPMTTNPVYLYLENGVPTRSTGFFNHNALYEMDVPHAARVEVVKGPATALYGSDAIGGMVNVLTRAPDDAAPFSVTGEGGSYGFGRMLASASSQAVLAELNITRTDGWRDGTSYGRQSGTLRWDHGSGATTLRTILSYSHIDQNTAGTSALPEEEYRTTPRLNLTPVSFREVHAVRASAAWERVAGSTLISVTPFARWNAMEMLPNWSLTYDPVISETGHASAGALIKARHDFLPIGLRAIAGLDLDYSPGSHREWQIAASREGGVFTDYTRGDIVYDYDVTFRSVSPYLQLEAAPLDDVRIVAGVRYDVLGYGYDNPLGALQTGSHRRPAARTFTTST
ncbi:MAG TPA: TonB-dependent receptor plug domain-containing protein [Longimicrobiales bacterium]|nr:TonB-dependent receptor plug domain-containing protein [Longimicrobiales bacterium]